MESFLNGKHPLSEDYARLFNELVPGMGEADTPQGEALRIVSKFYNDYYSNGNFNVAEEVMGEETEKVETYNEETGEYEWEEVTREVVEGYKVADHYQKDLDKLAEIVPGIQAEIDAVVEIIEQGDRPSFGGDEIYNEFVAKVVNWVKENPVQ